MLMDDIFHSCSHEKVAQAAVASIGGAFADRVRQVAAVRGLTPGFGVSVARIVSCPSIGSRPVITIS